MYIPTEEHTMTMTFLDLDYAILAQLPEEGTRLGVTTLAKQVKGVVTEINDGVPREGHITPAQAAARLRALGEHGYVVSVTVQPVSRGLGWQRTPKGKRLLAEHEAQGGMTIDAVTASAEEVGHVGS